MDDILVATDDNLELHRTIVREILQVMKDESLFLKLAKCEFEKRKVEYLGLILDHDTIRPDPTKVAGLREWPRRLKTVKEVRSTLGLLNYHRAFVPGFSHIVKLLTQLLKKGEPFLWTTTCTKALDRIIDILTLEPVLTHPDPNKPFELEVDASNFATGAILFQQDKRGKPKPIGFHSKTLLKEEMNYDIYDKELTVLDQGLETWRHLLIGRHTIIHTDHANLTFYRQPQKLSPRAKRAVARIMQYDIAIKHKPGLLNKADALSRRPDYPQGTSEEEIAFPPSLFVDELTTDDLLSSIEQAQQRHCNALHKQPHLQLINDLYYHGSRLIVPEDNELRRGVLSLYHDSTTAGHPGVRRTSDTLARNYWWANQKRDVINYIKGCATCQSTKPRTTRPKPPSSPIPPRHTHLPFGTITMDFITKLPLSRGHDSILTITDHDCSKAALLFPCKETITAEEVAVLYTKHVFPHYGIPREIITDRDPRFTSSFTRALLEQLGITKNMSTAFHPQTNGQSERTNQWVEQYLQIYGNTTQTDWADWLPLAQYVHNSWINESTKQIPFKLLIGGLPSRHYQAWSEIKTDEPRERQIKEIRQKATKALEHAQELIKRKNRKDYPQYKEGNQVWLEATNLKTTHPTAKLALKRYGPFSIIKKISDIVYQLELPRNWKIHNVFHSSLLSPYRETEIHGPNYHEPPPEIIEGEPEYKVEAVIGSRRTGKNRKLEYRIR